jgi:hypothetical protein
VCPGWPISRSSCRICCSLPGHAAASCSSMAGCKPSSQLGSLAFQSFVLCHFKNVQIG